MSDFYATRPDASEHIPYYAKYINLVPNGNILTILQEQVQTTSKFLNSITEEQSLKRYASGKWSIKEVIGHLSDNERIFAYRALRFARADKAALPSYESDDYIEFGHFDKRNWQELISEFEAVRGATVSLFKSLDEAAWTRQGVANNDSVSVRALAYIVAGHELHHVKLIQELYL
jgi:uncharacterized damage-inducible protein DinB